MTVTSNNPINFITRSTKSAARKVKETTQVVLDRTKDTRQNAVAKTKRTAGAAKQKFKKLDDQINLTGVKASVATGCAAHRIVHGRGCDLHGPGAGYFVAVAGASVAAKNHLAQSQQQSPGNGP